MNEVIYTQQQLEKPTYEDAMAALEDMMSGAGYEYPSDAPKVVSKFLEITQTQEFAQERMQELVFKDMFHRMSRGRIKVAESKATPEVIVKIPKEGMRELRREAEQRMRQKIGKLKGLKLR
jgi:hypothetical protein